ncbi:MAG: homoserine O-acetyltransferase [Verrucomicrobiales bacterium]|nr:homoserine O-acetyltransferase [Verrucomicrobiales bacterium]
MKRHIGKVSTQFFEFDNPKQPLRLRVGGRLSRFTLAYEMYGQMNADRSNVILLYHAMTGCQHAAGVNRRIPGLDGRWTAELYEGWWDGFIGAGLALDTRKYCVICVNYLGSCYGSTGPASIDPHTGRPYGSSFPVLRMSDIVDSQMLLLDHLGVKKLHGVIGASIGGYLSLLTATRYPERVQVVVPIGTGVETTIYQRIINFEQVTAIEADPNFRGGDYYDGDPPSVGLALARRIAHKTFVSLEDLRARARAEVVSQKPPHGWYEMNHPVESYMLHQGHKFVHRFDANSYLRILDAWQWFNLVKEADARDFGRLFARCRDQDWLVFSIDSDLSFPTEEQGKLVGLLKKADVPVMWITVHSDKGHDSFLVEPRLYTPHLAQVLER